MIAVLSSLQIPSRRISTISEWVQIFALVALNCKAWAVTLLFLRNRRLASAKCLAEYVGVPGTFVRCN